jgi:hypothetical protein
MPMAATLLLLPKIVCIDAHRRNERDRRETHHAPVYRGRVTTERITGTAYGRPASIEVTGDTVMWRARPEAAENIVTTIHDVRFASWQVQRTNWVGVGFAALGGVWIAGDAYIVGAIAFAIAATLIGMRLARPRRRLVLEVGANQLVLEVDAGSGSAARTLTTRIGRAIASGEVPASPPTLP